MILERQEAGLTDEKSEGRCVCWGFILHNPTGPSKSRVSLPLGAAPDDSLKNTDEISLFPDTLGSPDNLGLKRMSFSQGEKFLRMTTMSVGCNHRSVTLESASLWLDLFHKELGRDHLSRFLHINDLWYNFLGERFHEDESRTHFESFTTTTSTTLSSPWHLALMCTSTKLSQCLFTTSLS